MPAVPDGPPPERSGRAISYRSDRELGSSHELAHGLIRNAAATDQPTAALLQDLQPRGLLDEPCALWQRVRPPANSPRPRWSRSQHHRLPDVARRRWREARFLVRCRATNYGLHAVAGKMHTMDLHATLLALMGLDHESLENTNTPDVIPTDRCRRSCGQEIFA